MQMLDVVGACRKIFRTKVMYILFTFVALRINVIRFRRRNIAEYLNETSKA
jgi:hypothetical protein